VAILPLALSGFIKAKFIGAPDQAGVKRECGEDESPKPQLPPQL
jgi:hypothetical protein